MTASVEPGPARDASDGEIEAPIPSTERGPVAGLADLARFLQPGGTARRFAIGLLAGAAIGLALTVLRSLRRR